MILPAETYEDFVTWRKSLPGRPTVGDGMRRFTSTPLETLLEWYKRYRAEHNDNRPVQQLTPPPGLPWRREARGRG